MFEDKYIVYHTAEGFFMEYLNRVRRVGKFPQTDCEQFGGKVKDKCCELLLGV